MTVTFSRSVSDEFGLTASEGPEGVFDAVGSAFVAVPAPAVGVSVGAVGAPGGEEEAAPRRADECDAVAAATAVPQGVAAGPGAEFTVAGAGDAPC
ncbi:MAG TPA: hypothetical protein VKU86_08975 [Acidimicrobiales bacterium]|nr:hypothetical protein [Acidimicrobiales bacterium]